MKLRHITALLVVAVLAACSRADSAAPTYAVTWLLPTQYNSGLALPASDIASTTVVYKLNGGAAVLKVVTAPTTSTTIPKDLGVTCVAAFVTTTATAAAPNTAGSQTADICMTLAGIPNAPTGLTVQ
jgi:hypothetical protein